MPSCKTIVPAVSPNGEVGVESGDAHLSIQPLLNTCGEPGSHSALIAIGLRVVGVYRLGTGAPSLQPWLGKSLSLSSEGFPAFCGRSTHTSVSNLLVPQNELW